MIEEELNLLVDKAIPEKHMLPKYLKDNKYNEHYISSPLLFESSYTLELTVASLSFC